jgi:hypothetical protein
MDRLRRFRGRGRDEEVGQVEVNERLEMHKTYQIIIRLIFEDSGIQSPVDNPSPFSHFQQITYPGNKITEAQKTKGSLDSRPSLSR